VLRILTPSSASETRAQFSFGPSQLNMSVPDGSFSMVSHVDLSRGTMTLPPIEWIQRPETYVMVGLEGASRATAVEPSMGASSARVVTRSQCYEYSELVYPPSRRK
jgi:hypothetical protein